MQLAGNAGDVAQRSGLIARLFEEAEGPACVVDADSLIVYVNRAWTDLFGEVGALSDCLISVDGNDADWLRRAAQVSGFAVASCSLRSQPGMTYEIVCVANFVAGLDLVILSPQRPAPRSQSPSTRVGSEGLRQLGMASQFAGRRLLTDRELEIVTLLAKGLNGARVAAQLAIAESTVQAHVRNAMKKTGAANRTALVAFAMAEGWVKA